MNERMVSHYRLVEALGSGSMGRVFKAWDTRLDRWVAIKFLPPELADDTAACSRFHREAQAASSLEHGHICTIYDIDQDEAGGSFLVMAWYDGETLARKLEAGPLPTKQALDYARQLALGLAAAHRQGIIHRDIKPANLIITRDGEAVILDFGVAYLMDQTRLSRPGSRSGTLAYMAPEQFRGAEPRTAMDIWSLGILLYEMLTGRLPFKGDYTAALTYAIAHDDPQPLPEYVATAIPGSRAVMERCLAKHPEDRYDSATDLAADLALLINETQSGLAAKRPPFWIANRWRRRLAIGATAVVLVGVGIVAGMLGLIGGGAQATQGVAVLPFVLDRSGEPQEEFGDGLTWLVANRLGHLGGWTDAFWVVPPEDIFTYEIRDRDAVRNKFGVERTISASGTVRGSALTLQVEYSDASGQPPVTRVFYDDLANLPTWQRDVVQWAAGLLDPDLDPGGAAVLTRGSTQVPGALYDFLDGVAWLRRSAYRQPSNWNVYRDRALASLGQAVAQDSSFAAARSEYGHALLLRHDEADSTWGQRCETHLRAAIALDPLDAEPHYYLGRLFLARRDTQAAMAACEEALRREPGFKPALMAELSVAIARHDATLADRQIAALKAARPRYAIDCLNVGKKFYDVNDFDRSVAYYREAEQIVPRSPAVLEYLGAALFNLEKSPETEVLYRRALEIEPTARLHNNLGVYYYYDNRYDDAIREFQESLEIAPAGSYLLWRCLAESYIYATGFEDSVNVALTRARAMAQDLADAYPGVVEYKVDLAAFCAELDDSACALALLDEVVAVDHLDADAEFMISFIWERLGRRAEALDWLARALDHGLGLTRVENYPGFRNLRTDPQYAKITKEHE